MLGVATAVELGIFAINWWTRLEFGDDAVTYRTLRGWRRLPYADVVKLRFGMDEDGGGAFVLTFLTAAPRRKLRVNVTTLDEPGSVIEEAERRTGLSTSLA